MPWNVTDLVVNKKNPIMYGITAANAGVAVQKVAYGSNNALCPPVCAGKG